MFYEGRLHVDPTAGLSGCRNRESLCANARRSAVMAGNLVAKVPSCVVPNRAIFMPLRACMAPKPYPR